MIGEGVHRPGGMVGDLSPENALDGRVVELVQRGFMILDVAKADLETAEARLGSFHETTWYFRQALDEAKRAWDRLRIQYGSKAIEQAMAEPPRAPLRLGGRSNAEAVLILIRGKTYRARPLPATEDAPVLWRLDCMGEEPREDMPEFAGRYDLARLADGSLQCDCAEWFFRIMDLPHPTGLCKHLEALRSLGWL